MQYEIFIVISDESTHNALLVKLNCWAKDDLYSCKFKASTCVPLVETPTHTQLHLVFNLISAKH